MCVNWGGGGREGEGSGITKEVHVCSYAPTVHPLNYSFNVYQVLAVNSLYALFSCLVFTIHNHS